MVMRLLDRRKTLKGGQRPESDRDRRLQSRQAHLDSLRNYATAWPSIKQPAVQRTLERL